MREYLLLLPIIFIFHDMEEIVGIERFYSKNRWLFERYPKILRSYKGLTHMGFSAAVYEEFIPFFGVSLLAFSRSGNTYRASSRASSAFRSAS